MPVYRPIVIDVRMSDTGYWVVDVSVAPGRVVSMMIAEQGITPGAAVQYALTGLLPHPPGGSQ
jgi:hypothetical protein